MAIREYVKAGETAQWDENEVAEYLRGLGYQIGPGRLSTRIEVAASGTPSVVVSVDLDPHVPDDALAKDLAAFVPNPDPVKDAEVAMRVAVEGLRKADDPTDLDAALAMVAALRRVVLAYATILGV